MYYLILISFSFVKGGAGIAACKFRDLLKGQSLNLNVVSISQDSFDLFHFFKRLISYSLVKLQFDGNSIKHSLNIFTYKPVLDSFRFKTNSIYHFHWLNNETLSVFDFDKIPVGSIITLHDEWFFCGAEHYYKISDKSNDFIKRYRFFKRGVLGIHWNYFIWKIKLKKLANRTDLIYTVPSYWMLERAKSSAILRNAHILLLPNPINTEIFKPLQDDLVEIFRKSLGISEEKFIFVFGSIRGKNNKIKGFDLLEQAINLVCSKVDDEFISKTIFLDFGGKKSESYLSKFRNISLGHIRDFKFLSKVYSSADCVIVPSYIESFGQVAAESLACGTPVICFKTSGLLDIVIDNRSGFCIDPFNVHLLAERLIDIVKLSKIERKLMGGNGRYDIINNFSNDVIKKKYLDIINEIIKKNNL